MANELSKLLSSLTDDPSTEAQPTPKTSPRGAHASSQLSYGLLAAEVLLVVVIAVALTVALRVFVVQTYSIPSGSMEPTLMIGDRIVVDKLSYALHGVGRSDIVVFSRPAKERCAGPPVADLVKRVIGLPGETIALSDGQVSVNGKVLAEPWLPVSVRHATTPGPTQAPYSLHRPFVIPAHEVFVMGDNRQNSCDSRWWGPIPESSIVGKTDMIIWPLSRLHWF
jgi:signal peptidase I